MRGTARWIVVGLALPVLAVAAAVTIGWMLPEVHTATVDRVVAGSPEEVWAVITDVAAFPTWRSEVARVEVTESPDGVVSWVESGTSGTLPMSITRREPPSLLVTRIGEGLPFGGTWTYRLEPLGNGTRVTLVEDGEVYNPFFRFVSRFVMGHEATMDRYLDALEGRMATTAGGEA